MKQRRIFIFIGTTAELIKLAPVIQELNKRKINFSIIASGQNDIHFEEFASELGNLNIIYAVTPKGKDPSLVLFALWSVRTFFSLMLGMRFGFRGLNKSNSYFIVHGDTVSSLMGSLVATLYGLKLVHIESGLRSFNFLEPFPEEICRYIISRLADVHFCPNTKALKNLKLVKGEKVDSEQNTLIETFWSVMKKNSSHSLLRQLRKQKTKYFVLVTHRQEHVLFGKKKTTETLKFILSTVPKKFQCIFLVHDLSSDFISVLGSVVPQEIANRMLRVERLPYGDFMQLLQRSEFMITDGGSNQEEMYYMGKPCLLLRNCTERIEGLGENVLLSKNNKIAINKFIKNYKTYRRLPVRIDTRPSKIIADYLFFYERQ
jgi:UDP-N-acetylglucosamine 2-epimerase (non-hydrolysing)